MKRATPTADIFEWIVQNSFILHTVVTIHIQNLSHELKSLWLIFNLIVSYSVPNSTFCRNGNWVAVWLYEISGKWPIYLSIRNVPLIHFIISKLWSQIIVYIHFMWCTLIVSLTAGRLFNFNKLLFIQRYWTYKIIA